MLGSPRIVLGVLRGDPAALGRPAGARVARALIALTSVVANLIGAVVVATLLIVVLPLPQGVDGETSVRVRNAVAAAIYVLVAVLIGIVRGWALGRPVARFFASDREPTDADRRRVLRFPLRLAVGQGLAWAVAVVLFTLLNVFEDGLFGFEVGITVALGGIATTTFSYLYAVRLSRAGVARVLTVEPPRRREAPGVQTRMLAVWTATSAIPVAGALTLSIFALVVDVETGPLARATLVLSAIMLVFGLLGMVLLARSIGEPLRRLRDGLREVEAGDLDVTLPVHDATEIGFATAGLNRLVGGLREREQLRDLFGRQVGEDVARRALEEGVTLGGEEREAAALFVDVVGSTTFAAERGAADTVDALNAFFKVVVETTGEHGGLVNKFAGDAALCIFGAPLDQEDPAGAALACARALQARLRAELTDLEAGVGVAAGTVVAGNVGTPERYEYTVIGDAVNVAARLTDLAKERPSRVLASEVALSRARAEEQEHWRLDDDPTELRGRAEPIRVAEPVDGP